MGRARRKALKMRVSDIWRGYRFHDTAAPTCCSDLEAMTLDASLFRSPSPVAAAHARARMR